MTNPTSGEMVREVQASGRADDLSQALQALCSSVDAVASCLNALEDDPSSFQLSKSLPQT